MSGGEGVSAADGMPAVYPGMDGGGYGSQMPRNLAQSQRMRNPVDMEGTHSPANPRQALQSSLMGLLSRNVGYFLMVTCLLGDRQAVTWQGILHSVGNDYIVLYQPDYVPVGEDQKQHCELTRDVAQRFNHIYGDVFKIPEPYIPKVGARIMSLSDPASKMSKSDKDPNGSVYLMEKPEDIQRKFKRAVTDSDTEKCVRYAPEEKPGVSNLMAIYSAVTGKTMETIEAEFDGQGYGQFKPAVGDAVVECLRPIREETERLLETTCQNARALFGLG